MGYLYDSEEQHVLETTLKDKLPKSCNLKKKKKKEGN